MKKIFLAALSACMLTACESYTIEQVPSKVHVAFNMSTNDRMKTRSVLTANGAAMNGLYVFDYTTDDCELLGEFTGEQMSQPEVDLTVGQHLLSFMATRSDGVNIEDAGTMTTTKVKDTFMKRISLSVAHGMSPLSLSMNRVVSCVAVKLDDVIPASAASLRISLMQGSSKVDLTDGLAPTMAAHSSTISYGASDKGTVVAAQLNCFTFCPSATEEWLTDVTLEMLDGSGNVIGSHTIPDVSLKMNRKTELHGALLSQSGAFTVTLNDVWEEPVIKNF